MLLSRDRSVPSLCDYLGCITNIDELMVVVLYRHSHKMDSSSYTMCILPSWVRIRAYIPIVSSMCSGYHFGCNTHLITLSVISHKHEYIYSYIDYFLLIRNVNKTFHSSRSTWACHHEIHTSILSITYS